MTRVVPTLAMVRRPRAQARALMQFFWDTVEACVRPQAVMGALERAGLDAPRRTVALGTLFRIHRQTQMTRPLLAALALRARGRFRRRAGLARRAGARGRAVRPGSTPDIVARIVADRLAPRLGKPVVVDNKPGAGGMLGTDLVAKAAPDGQTIGSRSPVRSR
jgi:hypothetical protein